MYRFWKPLLLALPVMAVLAIPELARAAVVKCVDAQGKVTFTDQSCAPGSTPQQSNVQSGKKVDAGASAAAEATSDAARSKGSPQAAARAGFDAATEARIRDLQAQCRQGNQKACAEVQCAPALRSDARPSDFQQCSSAQGFKSTSAWAQMSAVQHRGSDQDDSISVTCLLNPEVLETGGTRSLVYRTIKVTRYAFQQGFSAYGLSGAKFDTWEQAADAACAK